MCKVIIRVAVTQRSIAYLAVTVEEPQALESRGAETPKWGRMSDGTRSR